MQSFMHRPGSVEKHPPPIRYTALKSSLQLVWVVAHFPLVHVLHFLPLKSAGTCKHRHQQQQAFHRGHDKRWNLQAKAMAMQFSLIQFGLNSFFKCLLGSLSSAAEFKIDWLIGNISTRLYTNDSNTVHFIYFYRRSTEGEAVATAESTVCSPHTCAHSAHAI